MMDEWQRGLSLHGLLQEDKENFCSAVRNEAKAAGLLDSNDNCWDFFINKVRPTFHLHHPCLCHTSLLFACMLFASHRSGQLQPSPLQRYPAALTR